MKAALVALCVAVAAARPPNIVFIIVESTAGVAWFPDRVDAPMELPNLWALADKGVTFRKHYVNAPVCCPSRAAIWSGRRVDRIPHLQQNPPTGLHVNGAWNNHEGLPIDFNQTYMDLLAAGGYNTSINGKTDFFAGGHSMSARAEAWLNRVPFPYTLSNHSYGWYDETGPVAKNVTGNETNHGDWASLRKLVTFIQGATKDPDAPPFAGYVGFNIVHPPYVSSEYWLSRINDSRITIPEWEPINDMHPEDFQSSMKKKMASDLCCTDFEKLNIRRHYYAMIAEFDAMVGTIVDAVKEAGVEEETLFIVTSDHGDMNMEHRQFYKMVHFESSSRVPLIISGPGVKQGITVDNVTSSLDFFPTMMDYAEVSTEGLPLDGQSLKTYLETGKDDNHRDAVISMFAGDNIRLPWYLLRKGDMKYVTYGTGTEVPPRLYNITADPGERYDLASSQPAMVAEFDAELRKEINYPSVSADVESYNKASFSLWRKSLGDKFNETIQSSEFRFSESWKYDPEGCFEAIETWLAAPNTSLVL